MKKLLLSLMALGVCSPAFAGSKIKEFYTMNSMGCMILRECTEDVRRINSISDIESYYPDSDFSVVADEFNSMLLSLNKIGVKVFLGAERYFPAGHRGVYHTVSNNFFLNERFMHRQSVLMSVMRHEGWHAAQDCMAGTIDNNFIAIIKIKKMSQGCIKRLQRVHMRRNHMLSPGRKKHTGQVTPKV